MPSCTCTCIWWSTANNVTGFQRASAPVALSKEGSFLHLAEYSVRDTVITTSSSSTLDSTFCKTFLEIINRPLPTLER